MLFLPPAPCILMRSCAALISLALSGMLGLVKAPRDRISWSSCHVEDLAGKATVTVSQIKSKTLVGKASNMGLSMLEGSGSLR